MPATLIPTRSATCPLCGLRFTGRPMMELHARDDHQNAVRTASAHPHPHRVPGPRRAGGQRPAVRGAGPADAR